MLAEAPVASPAAMLFALLSSFDEASCHTEFNSRARGEKQNHDQERTHKREKNRLQTKPAKEKDDKSRSGNALRQDDDETLRASPQSHGSDLFRLKGREMLEEKGRYSTQFKHSYWCKS
jgi:hypothetical protein